MPERNVLPKPLQDPHPPLWVTVTSPGTEVDAADRGIGCLGVAAAGYDEQERRTREYHRRIQLCDPVSSVVNDQVTTLNFMYCHEERATALSTGQRMFGLFGVTNAHLLWTREAYPTRGLPDAREPRAQARHPGAPCRTARRGSGRDRDRRSRRHRRRDQAVGVDRRRRAQLHPQRAGDDPAAGGARQPPPVRGRGDAPIREPEAGHPPPHRRLATDVLVGTAPVEPLAERAVRVERFAGETVELPDATVVLAHFELPYAVREILLPPSLHPNTPPILTVLAWRCPESPWGAFSLAQLRVGCRSGVRTRGLLLGAAIDNPDAAAALAAGGARTRPADVRLRRGYDASSVEVAFRDPAGPIPALRLRLARPRPARARRRPVLRDADPGRDRPRAPARAVRARLRRGPLGARPAPPRPARRDRWGDARAFPRGPVAASVTAATIVLRPVRFVCRADVTGFEGTEPVDA